ITLDAPTTTVKAKKSNYDAISRTGMFFFSSRRRHTRSKRDWSSDVCSSDLRCRRWSAPAPHSPGLSGAESDCSSGTRTRSCGSEIGRASCRERVWITVGGALLKKNESDNKRKSDTHRESCKRKRIIQNANK